MKRARGRERFERDRRACDEVGRDPATLRRTWGSGRFCAPTEAEVAELAAERLQMGKGYGYPAGEDFVGTPAKGSPLLLVKQIYRAALDVWNVLRVDISDP